MTITIFIISWVLVGLACATILTYLDYREGTDVTLGDLIMGTIVGILFGYLIFFMLIKGLIYDYAPPKFWKKVILKKKGD